MKALCSVSMILFILFAANTPAAPSDPSSSIYRLEARLTNQAGGTHGLDVHRGHPVLITMFYGSCPMACPLLIDTLRAAEHGVPEPQRADLRVLMISIDPEHDTPAALQKLGRERRIDSTRWTLARTDERTTRRIAAVLGIQYRKLPSGGYNHSSIVTLLSPTGEIVAQSSAFGQPDQAFRSALGNLTKQRKSSIGAGPLKR